jgi:HD-like signal output (HDOD) protein
MDHCQAGLLLTQQWGFPSDYSRVAGCHHAEMPVAKHDVVSLTHTACQLADALGFPSVTFAQAPSAAAIAAEFPTNPWSPYTFQEVQLRQRIARQIASL